MIAYDEHEETAMEETKARGGHRNRQGKWWSANKTQEQQKARALIFALFAWRSEVSNENLNERTVLLRPLLNGKKEKKQMRCRGNKGKKQKKFEQNI